MRPPTALDIISPDRGALASKLTASIATAGCPCDPGHGSVTGTFQSLSSSKPLLVSSEVFGFKGVIPSIFGLLAQSCGLVHRDIKPANIFLYRYGEEYDFVKVPQSSDCLAKACDKG